MKTNRIHTETQGCITVTVSDCNDIQIFYRLPESGIYICASSKISKVNTDDINKLGIIDTSCNNSSIDINTSTRNSNISISCNLVCTISDGLYILFSSDAYLLTIDDQYLIPVKDG